MAIGERIHFFRTLRGMTQKYLGMADGRACLQADIFQGGRQASELNKILIAWREQAAKLEAGEITKEDYDRWRYNYPKYDTTQRWAKVPSKELSDALIKGLKKQRKDK